MINAKHPEQRPDELWLENSSRHHFLLPSTSSVPGAIGYDSKRAVAHYYPDGTKTGSTTEVSVMVNRQEYEDRISQLPDDVQEQIRRSSLCQ